MISKMIYNHKREDNSTNTSVGCRCSVLLLLRFWAGFQREGPQSFLVMGPRNDAAPTTPISEHLQRF